MTGTILATGRGAVALARTQLQHARLITLALMHNLSIQNLCQLTLAILFALAPFSLRAAPPSYHVKELPTGLLKTPCLNDKGQVIGVLGAKDVKYYTPRPEVGFPNPGVHDIPVEKPVRAWLASDTASLRASAVTMLERLSLPRKVWIEAENQALKDPVAEVRMAAITALAQVPCSNSERLSHLTDALGDNEPQVRRRAVEALGDMGSMAKEALPVLLASLQGPSPTTEYRATVIHTFGKIGREAKQAVPYLRSLLHDEMDGTTSLQSLRALGSIGPSAKDAFPEVLALCEHDGTELRRNALETLGRISDDAGQKIPIFLKALDDPSAEVRQRVIAGIGRLGKEAGPAADRLVDLLDSESDAKAALEALREIRPENLDLCLRLLKSDNVGGRLFACDRLGRLKDRRALPELRIAREEDEHRYVRRRAREAISRIERDKK